MKEKTGKHILRAIISVSTRLYILVKSLVEKITRKIKFSISFKMAIRYFRWLFGALLLSSIVINLTLAYIVLISDWREIRDSGRVIIESIEYGNEIDYEVIQENIVDKGLTLYMLRKKSEEQIIWGEGTIGDYKYNQDYFKFLFVNKIEDKIVFVFARDVNISNNAYKLIINKDISEKVYFLWKFLIYSLIGQGVVFILSLSKGIRTNWKILKPIKVMTNTAKKISGANLTQRFNLEGVQEEFKELAETINQMMNRIEVSYNQQQQFVSDASHELRTPIAVVQGYTNMLDRWGKNDSKVLDESIEAIKNEAENMKNLIEQLLFLARNDKQTLILNKESFNISDLLDELVRETKLIEINRKIISDIKNETIYFGDRARIKQAIRVFINNASKYTNDDGEINISLIPKNNEIILSIKDNGIGISGSDIKNIFERFYRADKSRTKAKGGYGLGLPISKTIILAHGGKIKVRSKEGEGSEFIIYLPNT